MKKTFCILFLFFCFNNLMHSQGKFVVQSKKGVDKIRFRLINNLIVIPVEINGVELSFILDTGVSKPIIFNFLNITDTLQIKNSETIFLRGLGKGEPVKALKSTSNLFKIGEAININQDLYAVYDAKLNFAPRLGIPIHGIIGYDLFKDLVVEINYNKKYLRVTNPENFRYKSCKKCETVPLEFYNKKPYVDASVELNNKTIQVKLLIDSGGSDALWLFEEPEIGLEINENYFHDYLGHGLSGSVYGKRSKVESFSINRFTLKRANVAFPDSVSINHAKQFKNRNGSLAGNILKRFNLIVDYGNASMTLKKNNHFHDDFNYNKSGIELVHDGIRLLKEEKTSLSPNAPQPTGIDSYMHDSKIVHNTKYKLVLKPAYKVSELREGSPAEKAGLMTGDMLISINSRYVDDLSLQEIMRKFYGDTGTLIRLKIDRNGQILWFEFYLESLID